MTFRARLSQLERRARRDGQGPRPVPTMLLLQLIIGERTPDDLDPAEREAARAALAESERCATEAAARSPAGELVAEERKRLGLPELTGADYLAIDHERCLIEEVFRLGRIPTPKTEEERLRLLEEDAATRPGPHPLRDLLAKTEGGRA